jgi:EAL and modified HD-GYP domain-containing signal transduction protein
MEDIYVARQPIYNRAMEVTAYDLLFRDAYSDSANITDGALASSRLIINTFMSIGLENLVGSSPAFINLTADFFIDEQPIPMNKEQVVLEIPLDILSNKAVMAGVRELVRAGYSISLDNFTYSEESIPMLEVASYVKLDMAQYSHNDFAAQYALCSNYNVQRVATKVETLDDLNRCRDMGFEAYQGYFFCQPDIIKGKLDACNRGILLSIVDRMQEPYITMPELANIITQDVGLSYKLLRYINSATYAVRREVNTVGEALMMIGTERVKKWAILILMSNYNQDKPRELSVVAMIRAQMCELLARRHSGIDHGQAFTVGLFSTLDAVMDTPMVELLDTISLTSQIKFALLDYEGELGKLLRQVIHYERGEWEELDTVTLRKSDYTECYLAAVQWANHNRTLV